MLTALFTQQKKDVYDLIWNDSVSKIGAVRTAAYQNLVPVLGLVFGVVLLQEALTLQQYSGSTLVIIGIIFSRF